MLEEKQKQKVLQILRLGGTWQDAAAQAKCKRVDIRSEVEVVPDFSLDLIKAENDVKISVLTSIRTAAQKDWRAAAWLLERMWPEEFSGKEMAPDLLKEIDQGILKVGEQLFNVVPSQHHSAMFETLNQLTEK